MAKEKKGAKFGRHSRNPSSKLYASNRYERNRRKRWEKHKASHPKDATVQGINPEFPRPHVKTRSELLAEQRVIFSSPVTPQAGIFLAMHEGVVLETSDSVSACIRAKTASFDGERVRIFQRVGSQLVPYRG